MNLPPQLQRALDALATFGVDAAVEALRGEMGGGPAELPEWLALLARIVRARDRQLALQLAERALAEDETCVEALLAVGVGRGDSGQAAAATSALLSVLNTPNARPQQVLIAATSLISSAHQEAALAAATRAYAALDKPLLWTGALLDIAQQCADWPLAGELQSRLAAAHAQDAAGEVFEEPRTHANWCGDESVNLRQLASWSARTLPLPPPGSVPTTPPAPLHGRRLRVGYLSSDFREHPAGRLLNGLFRAHDKSALELFMYCSGWDDGSPLRGELQSHFEHVHRVAALSDAAAAALMRSHGIDVLVDLNGPTLAHRMGILAHRPAPVQIDYLGWPGSVGGRVVDYIVADDYVVPSGRETAYPERLIRLFPTYWVSGYRERDMPPTREAVGLPPGGPVLGAFNVIAKVGAQVWATWMEILTAVPEASLWLIDPGPVARRHIARFTTRLGVNPQRIMVAPRMPRQDRHLARLQCCDLMLDPWPYGGHTTTSDALHAGVPVIALEGGNFPSRVSGSLLRAAGLEVLVQPSREAYVRTAVDLLRNPEKLARLRRFVADEVPGTLLFNTASRARQLEKAYRLAYERAVNGLPPVNLNFTPETP